jgi:hypothetical protein
MAATKVYQNVSIQQLTDWSATNPYRNHSLAPIKIQTGGVVQEQGTSLASIGLPDYTAIPVQGMLHVFEWMRNPLFSDASVSVRASFVRTLATTFQTEVDTLLAGSPYARKRRRIYDGVGALLHGTPLLKDDERLDIVGALAHLSGLQLLLVKQPTTEGQVAAATETTEPSDPVPPTLLFSSPPTTWSASVPTWVIDWHGRWVGITDELNPLQPLLSWALHLDPNQWHVQWPTVEGTKEDIVKELSTTSTWKATDSKLKKDVLALRLGRIRVLAVAMQ